MDNGMILLFGAPDLIQSYQRRFRQLKQNDVDHQLAEQRRAAAPPPPPPVTPPQARTVVEPVPQFSLTFTIDRPGFESLLFNEPSRLTAILPSNCSLEKHIFSADIPVEVPLSHAQHAERETTTTTVDDAKSPPADNRSLWEKIFGKKPATPSASSPTSLQPSTSIQNSTSLKVGQAKISVCQGDLRTQQVKRIGFLLRSFGTFCRSMRSLLPRHRDTCAKRSSKPPGRSV